MAPSLPSSSTPLRATGIVITCCTLGPCVYYAYCESVRHFEISKRRRRYEAKRTERDRRRLIEAVGVGEVEDVRREEENEKKYGRDRAPLEEEEMNEVRRAFGSFRIGGRWSNCLGWEWREQGAWEWLFWKLVYQPLTGRIWWDGGVPKDPEELAASLPTETPNFVKLFGFLPSSSAPISPSTSSKDLSDSWDHLSVGSSMEKPQQQVTPSTVLTFTWIGQSTSFVQLDGVGILTDPVFAFKTVETFMAPPRLCPPPCKLADLLPAIQVVLVSHDHFDHVHPDDVREIGDSAQWLCPLGLGAFLSSCGVSPARIIELDWWQSTTLSIPVPGSSTPVQLDFHCTPAQHWAARSATSVNQSLWAGWAVKGARESFFHAGDTGYSSEVFKAIGTALGPFSLAALPIGAYLPRWHLASQHASPEDAIKIHKDIGARRSIGVHHGTWVLSDEHYLDPPKDLAIAREKFGIDEDEFRVVPPGRTLSWSRE